MKRLLGLVLLSVIGFNSSALAASYATYSPEGLWLTENKRSVIKLEKCGETLCGHIVWIIEGGMQYDTKNPEKELQGQAMCGLQIVQGLKQNPKGPNNWDGGKIYKADDGDVYDASLRMKKKETLVVRGYMGISLLGKSQTWMRVNESQYPKCKVAK